MDDVTWLVWIDRGKTAAAFLVAVGVAMEFALGWLEGPARNRIDEAREARIAEANKGAADANRRAAEANAHHSPASTSPPRPPNDAFPIRWGF